MFGVSEQFLAALRTSHQVEIRVDAYTAGATTRLASDLPVAGGSVSAEASSQVRRTLDLTIADPTLMPTSEGDALSPYGTELYVLRGLRFPTGTIEWCPLGVFRVEDVKRGLADAAVQVTGADRAKAVADRQFEKPRQPKGSNTRVQWISTLVQEMWPGVAVTDSTANVDAMPYPPPVWEQDRWAAIEELATSIGADVYFGPRGGLVIRPEPTIDDPVAWWVDAGASGVLVDGERNISREGTYNVVVATGEASGPFAPARAVVADTDPASPTRVDGPFGRVPTFYSSPLLRTTQQAIKAATALLGRARALNRQLELSSIPNPALEPGDVIEVRLDDGSSERHLVDKVTCPLDPATSMGLSTRSTSPDTT
jgi:hypothetical protein